ncbi:MAG: Coenzyme F420 hydrogenase/dehydrogenase, beta subunit C-terminal domain [Erythrobacter sp.]|uniref:Coenzyme F420 hydrogenase/dehydrogenase, beta subunit C-terminal domain n=1 Tax=Erythrobacter sp. TaxID=1042 RepID=UPI003C749B87
MTRSIEEIRSSGLCAGCGMCAAFDRSGAIQMEESTQGWMRPAVKGLPDPRVQEVVEKACPGIKIVDPARETGEERHVTWGPVAETHFSWSTNRDLRHLASSGGGLSGLLAYLVETGEVNFVLTNSMSDESPIRNARVEARDLSDIKHAAGSRYAPSSPLANIDTLLDGKERFAFVGKPCDVAALRQLGRSDSRVNDRVAWMFAFFCAGVPSYGGTDVLLSKMGVPDSDQIESFRYRGEGWPGFAKARMKSGNAYRMDYDTSWGTILSRHLQFRCKICPDGIGEFADISFADGWYLDANGRPSFSEAEGRSLTLTRSARAQGLFERAVNAGYLAAEPADIASVAPMQPFQSLRKGLVNSRVRAFRTVGHRRPQFEGVGLAENASLVRISLRLKNYIGTLRRLIRRRSEL